jgi:hypothetical protein
MSEIQTASRRPWSKCWLTRPGGNSASGSAIVVTTWNDRGQIPAIPISAMAFTTVLKFTATPASCNSAMIRGEAFVPWESSWCTAIWACRSALAYLRPAGSSRAMVAFHR